MTYDDVETEIRKMIAEMKSGHNDGWVQGEYRQRLTKLKMILELALREGPYND